MGPDPNPFCRGQRRRDAIVRQINHDRDEARRPLDPLYEPDTDLFTNVWAIHASRGQYVQNCVRLPNAFVEDFFYKVVSWLNIAIVHHRDNAVPSKLLVQLLTELKVAGCVRNERYRFRQSASFSSENRQKGKQRFEG
jgi:hypothetical protein